jgi:hypothetical protein
MVYAAGGLALSVALGGFLLPRQWTVTRVATVAARPDKIFAVLEDLRQWPLWAPWHEADPFAKMEYAGPERGRGAQMAWPMSDGIRGGVRLTTCEPVQRVVALGQLGSMGQGTLTFELIPLNPTETEVRWTLTGDASQSPAARYAGLVLASSFRTQCERGLAKLKSYVESPSP